jgi:hypothetical protein
MAHLLGFVLPASEVYTERGARARWALTSRVGGDYREELQ